MKQECLKCQSTHNATHLDFVCWMLKTIDDDLLDMFK